MKEQSGYISEALEAHGVTIQEVKRDLIKSQE